MNFHAPGNPDNSSWHPYVNERDALCNQVRFAESLPSTAGSLEHGMCGAVIECWPSPLPLYHQARCYAGPKSHHIDSNDVSGSCHELRELECANFAKYQPWPPLSRIQRLSGCAAKCLNTCLGGSSPGFMSGNLEASFRALKGVACNAHAGKKQAVHVASPNFIGNGFGPTLPLSSSKVAPLYGQKEAFGLGESGLPPPKLEWMRSPDGRCLRACGQTWSSNSSKRSQLRWEMSALQRA